MNLREAAAQALEYLEQHAIIGGAPIRDALRAALEPVTTCHELSKEGDKLSLPFNHFPDVRKMVATSQESRQVEPVAWLIESYDIYAKRTLQRLVFDNPKNMQGVKITAYYTAPPKGEPMTEQQLDDMFDQAEIAIYLADRQRAEHLEVYSFGVRDAEKWHGIGSEE